MRGWLKTCAVYCEPASLRLLLLGFSAGLPLPLLIATLSFWLREAGLERKSIGYLSWIGLIYAFKWVWSPLVDRLALPLLTKHLGQRRSWLLLGQALAIAGLLGMAANDPQQRLAALVACALLVAFGSATQDIALDAYRIESAPPARQAALAAMYQSGYRLALIWAGAGALWIAARVQPDGSTYSFAAWRAAYGCMAASMLVGAVTVLLAPEPTTGAAAQNAPNAPARRNLRAWLRGAFVAPFADFIGRWRWQAALLLALIALYRISDVVMGVMANPFYVDMGYSKEEVAAVSKVFGLLMTLLGAFAGGALALRWGIMRALLLGALLSAGSNLLFAWLAARGHDVRALIAVVSADNLAAGLASAAFIAYLSALTNVQYSATQYALFSSVMLLLPKWLGGFSGAFVDAWGYPAFFTATALLGVPVLVLIVLAARFQRL